MFKASFISCLFLSENYFLSLFPKYLVEKENDTVQLPIPPYLRTIIDHDNQLYIQVNMI